MGFLVILLGLHQLLTLRRAPSARAFFLGSGLVLAGSTLVLDERSSLHAWSNAAAWPFLIAALFFAYRDGTLGDTFRCRRRRGHAARSPADESLPDPGV